MHQLHGRRALVTGATSGIGEVTARELARMGATVLVHGRNREKGAATIERLRRQTGSEDVHFVACDLASLADIARFCDEIVAQGPLNLLVNNAGAMHTSRKVTRDGFEMTFGVNHLAYFAMTLRLMPALLEGKARTVHVASRAHRMGQIRWDDLQSEKRYSAFPVYGTSKLMNILFSAEFGRRVQGTGITSNAVHPGVVKTGFAMNDEGWLKTAWSLFANLVAYTPEQGARTSLYVATSAELEGVTSQYFADSRAVEPWAAGRDEDAARRLWSISEELTGLVLADYLSVD